MMGMRKKETGVVVVAGAGGDRWGLWQARRQQE